MNYDVCDGWNVAAVDESARRRSARPQTRSCTSCFFVSFENVSGQAKVADGGVDLSVEARHGPSRGRGRGRTLDDVAEDDVARPLSVIFANLSRFSGGKVVRMTGVVSGGVVRRPPVDQGHVRVVNRRRISTINELADWIISRPDTSSLALSRKRS